MLSSETMWSYLQRLPQHLTANHVLAMLGFCEVVVMQTAQVYHQHFWQEALKKSNGVRLTDEEKRCHLALSWMFRNELRVEGLRLDNSICDWNNFLSEYRHLLRSVELSISHRSNTYTALSEDVAFLQKIYSLHLGSNMDLTLAEAVALHSTSLKELSIAHPSNIPIADLIWARNPGLSSLSILCALEADLLHRIQRCGASLRKLEVMLDVDQCAAVAAACPHLISLSLTLAPTSSTIDPKSSVPPALDAILMAFAERCPSLTRVTLLGFRVTSTAVRMLALRCPRLQSFQASGRIDMDAIRVFAEHNSPLEKVTAASSIYVLTEHPAWLSHLRCAVLESGCLRSPHTGMTVAYMTQLRRIELHGFPHSEGLAVHMAPALDAIAEHCRHLTEITISNLDLNECRIEQYLCAVLSRCSGLQQVRIDCKSGTRPVSFQLVTALSCLAPQLLDLGLGGFELRDDDLLSIIGVAFSLQRLRLSAPGTQSITDALMFALAECCMRLQALTVKQSSGLISEEAVLHVIHHCRRLRELNVSINRGCGLSQEARAALTAQYEAGHRLHKIEMCLFC